MRDNQRKKGYESTIFFLFSIFIVLIISFTYHNEIQKVEAVDEVQQEETQQEWSSGVRALDHEQIRELTDQFMNLILQDIDESYRVTNYDTKEELLDAFEKIAAREVAEPYVDFYFEEKRGSMYILPTEAPSWFVEENEYDMIQLADNKVKLVQDNYMELYGSYTIEIEFTYENEWKITEINYS